MSRLTAYDGERQVLSTESAVEIQAALAAVGVQCERWRASVALPVGASAEQILAAYAPEIDRLKARGGYVQMDVVRLGPDHPDRAAIRQKFLAEHTHSDDEVRFFVEGSGLFCFHIGDRVYQLVAEAGDLVNVPAGTTHWFDTGAAPSFTAIRLFVDPAGWVAHYTGSSIATRYPLFE